MSINSLYGDSDQSGEADPCHFVTEHISMHGPGFESRSQRKAAC